MKLNLEPKRANLGWKGWTQTDMAVTLDMNRGHISDIEQGKREAGIITLQVIARGLGTTMSELLRRL
jgi:transcriptional regulator with XRE-family HTH domain